MTLEMGRQRRRIAIVLALMSLALALAALNGSGWLKALNTVFGAGLMGWLQTLVFALTATLAGVVTVLRFAPAQRQQAEVWVSALVLYELLTFGLALFGIAFTKPLLELCTFGLFVLAIDHVLYGRLLDIIDLWRPLSSRHSFTVRATPNAAWNAIVPRPDTVATHWIGALSAVTPTREPDTFIARYRLGDGTILQKSLTVLSDTHPEHIRYHFEPEADDEESRYGAGFYEVWLDPIDEDHTEVTLLCEYTALRFRTALQLWLDDWLGSEADAIHAYIEGRPDHSIHARLWRDVLRQV